MKVKTLVDILTSRSIGDFEVRVGDVAELDALHTTVGSVVIRNQSIIFTPGSNDLWKDETLATEQLKEVLYDEDR